MLLKFILSIHPHLSISVDLLSMFSFFFHFILSMLSFDRSINYEVHQHQLICYSSVFLVYSIYQSYFHFNYPICLSNLPFIFRQLCLMFDILWLSIAILYSLSYGRPFIFTLPFLVSGFCRSKIERITLQGHQFSFAIAALPRFPRPELLSRANKVALVFDLFNRDFDRCLSEIEFFMWQARLNKPCPPVDTWENTIALYKEKFGCYIDPNWGKIKNRY